MKNIIKENNNENDFFNKNINIIKDKIFLIKKEIKELKMKQNSIKKNQEEEIKLLKDTYENTLNKEQQLQISISTITKHIHNLKEKYQKKINYLIKLENAKLNSESDKKENIKGNGGNKKLINRNSKNIKDGFYSLQKKKKDIKDEEGNINVFRKRSQSIKTKFKKEI